MSPVSTTPARVASRVGRSMGAVRSPQHALRPLTDTHSRPPSLAFDAAEGALNGALPPAVQRLACCGLHARIPHSVDRPVATEIRQTRPYRSPGQRHTPRPALLSRGLWVG